MSKWLVTGLMPKGHIIMIAGKSWWAEQLAVDVAHGQCLHLGEFTVELSSVVIIDEDTPIDVFEERMTRLAARMGKKVGDLPIECRPMQGFRLLEVRERQALVQDIRNLNQKGKPVLVVMDSLIKAMAGENINTPHKASKVMAYLTEVRDAGATVVVTHHTTLKKEVTAEMWDAMGLVLGSTMLPASSDTAFTILRVPKEELTVFVIGVEQRRLSLPARLPFAIELFEDKAKAEWARLRVIEEVPKLPS